MKRAFITLLASLFVMISNAQIGIGTTTPNSTLDVRGSIATSYRAFTTSTSATSTDNLLVFTGTSACSLILPTAVGCDGRNYVLKNASAATPTPVVTITTTSSQTIDGISSWLLDETNETVTVISNGANWNIVAQSLPTGSGTSWTQGGNSVASIKKMGTISNYDLPFITNNTEKMRLTTTGNMGIGTSIFNVANPEKLLVDAGATSSVNAIVGKGSIDSYLQLNIQNNSAGSSASSDVVATANNGSETTNYVDMGINGGSYTGGIMGAANGAYLFNIGQNFLVGTGTAAKSLIFMTGGTSQSANERMRIDGSGNVGVGVTNPANPLVVRDTLEIRRLGAVSELLFSNTAGTGDFRIGGDGSDIFWQGGGGRNLQMGAYWGIILAGDRASSSFPSFSAGVANTGVLVQAQRDVSVPLGIQANSSTQSANLTEWRNSAGAVLDVVNENGSVGIGTSTFNGTNTEKLIVDAGTTTSVNAIVGKGSIDSYLQLNIQNNSSGTSASSDVVATANNGNETTNYIDMGINGGSYTGGVMGAANDSYLYNTGQNFLIGTGTAAKSLVFMTGGTTQASNERMRINGVGNVGVGNNNPNSTLSVTGSLTMSYRSGTGAYTVLATDYVVINTGAAATWTMPAASSCTGRIYRLINHGTGNITLSAAVTTANATTTTTLTFAAGSNFFEILSDGTVWRRIN